MFNESDELSVGRSRGIVQTYVKKYGKERQRNSPVLARAPGERESKQAR